jgi:hypothetical protein
MMTRDELLKQYVALKSARTAGIISPEEYAGKVTALRYKTADGQEYAIDEDKGSFVPVAPPDAPKETSPAESALPDRFFPLLAVILKKTIATFLRRLPITVLFGLAGLLVHTYLLAVINNGFQKSSSVSAFLALGNNTFSVMVMWMIGSAIIMSLLSRLWPFGRKKKRIPLREKIAAVSAYLSRKRVDALAVIAASVGLALVMGALVSGTANMSLAIGVGALFASRAGSVIALLARTAWNTAFSTFRGATVKTHGMAVGYVALFASSLGFLLNTMLTPNGTQLGLLLLAGAMAVGVMQRFGPTRVNSVFILIAIGGAAAALVGIPLAALAHDGGWPEYMGNAPVTPGNVLIYLQKGGSIEAVMAGVPPALAASFGAAFAQALNALGMDVDVNLDVGPDGEQQGGGERDNTRIRDGDDARNWMIRNGYFDANGNPTQKYHDWQKAPHSEDDGSGLRGVATNPDGSIVIVTADDTSTGQSGDQGGGTPDPDGQKPDDGESGGTGQPGDDTADDTPVDGGGDPSGNQPDWNRGDEPGGDPGTTTSAGTGPGQDVSDDQNDSGTRYNDPEWSMRNNPDPNNMDWDSDTNSWRPKDDIHAEKMERQDYGFDPDTDSWRKRPEPPQMDDVPDYAGTKYSTEWKPGLITYDVTTEGLDKHIDNLNQMERDALDAYSDINDRINRAERDGDTWLANELRGQRDDLRSHIGNVQKQKNHIVNAVNNENTRVSDYNDKIRKPGLTGHAWQTVKDGTDIAVAIWNDPSLLTKDPDFVKKVRDGIAAAEKVRKGEGVELRPGMFGYDAVKTGPSHLEKFDDALRDVKDIQTLIDEAQKRGDQGAVDALNKQLNEAKQNAQDASDNLQKHVQNIKKWQVKSAQANLSIGRKGAEITAEVAAVPATAHAVTNLIDDFNRGQGWFNRSTFKDSPDGDLDIDLNTPSHQRPVKMTQADLDLDAEFHANLRVGTERADKVLQVMDDPDATDAQKAEAINRALESRNSKIQLNSQSQDVNEKFFELTNQHRTTPLFQKTSDNLNAVEMPDGTKRYYVVDPDTGLERSVTVKDWKTASGPKTYPDGTPKNSVGQDLDFYNPDDCQIIDRVTGKPASPDAVNEAIDAACNDMKINRHAQEINYTHSMDSESYRLRPGETPKQHIQNAPNYDNYEAQHASRITEHKSNLARDHYDTGAESLSEGGRGAVKERNRIVQQMLDSPESVGAKTPEYFNNLTSLKKPDGSHKTVLEVLDDIGYDRVPTGEGQAAIRAATGRDIREVDLDIAKLQESLIKLRPRG